MNRVLGGGEGVVFEVVREVDWRRGAFSHTCGGAVSVSGIWRLKHKIHFWPYFPMRAFASDGSLAVSC